ncbi:MAG: TIM barrel protein [Anaerolineae bacterium]|nr:sugar phosphate isomerase/epimerase [Thermoflexales bacterium]MDW8408956.1 TIM barrel protein [Anaerolineae bacterium]
MSQFQFGVNLSFAVKRWPEPEAWARIVREVLNLHIVQFTFDLLDPWWPDDERCALAGQIKAVAAYWDIRIHSAFVGLASYTYNGLLHPEPALRRVALEWWQRAVQTAASLGATAVGGPLGGMSCQQVSDPSTKQRVRNELVQHVHQIAHWAADAGLQAVLIEPTPLTREIPHTVEDALHFLDEIGSSAVPIHYVLDVGHALYRPLYGLDASLNTWLTSLGEHIGLFHLQNTDFQSDSHWGWPHEQGKFDVSAFTQQLSERKLDNRPIFLEVFYPFELSDAQVLENIASSVKHCLRSFG